MLSYMYVNGQGQDVWCRSIKIITDAAFYDAGQDYDNVVSESCHALNLYKLCYFEVEPCAVAVVVLKNRTPKPRLWFHFWNILLSGAVAVLDVWLWFYRENRGCILNKGDCIIYRSNCILYRGNCILYRGNCILSRGSCIIYRGGCKFTAVVAYLKNLRFWRFNRNRGFGSCLAVLVRLRCYFFQMWLTAGYKK
jgi:hypothetical protein